MPLTDWANLGTVVLGITGVLALVFAYWQARAIRWQTAQARRQQLEMLARGHYQRFVELCVQYPEYTMASVLEEALDLEAETFKGDRMKFYQYEWFFAAMGNSFETMFETVGRRGEWRQTMVIIMREHEKYVRSKRFDDTQRPTVMPEFQRFVDEEVFKPLAPSVRPESVDAVPSTSTED
jgi:hypothetical protein